MIVYYFYYDDNNNQLFLLNIITNYELRITIIMEIQDGVGYWIDGLWQTCARTVHGYYYFWVENPFFMFV